MRPVIRLAGSGLLALGLAACGGGGSGSSGGALPMITIGDESYEIRVEPVDSSDQQNSSEQQNTDQQDGSQNTGSGAGHQQNDPVDDSENTPSDSSNGSGAGSGNQGSAGQGGSGSATDTGSDSQAGQQENANSTDTGNGGNSISGELVTGFFQVTSSWQGGFGAEISITNQGQETYQDWSLTCDTSLQIDSIWNVSFRQEGNYLEVSPLGWNGTLAPGQTLTFGMNSSSDVPAIPLSHCQFAGVDMAFEVAGANDTTASGETGTSTGNVNESQSPDGGQSGTGATNGDAANGQVLLSTLQAREAELTSSGLMQEVKASIATRDNDQVEKIDAGRYDNPENVKRVEGILSAQDWEYLFPRRAPEYSYRKFLQAVGKFPAFCGDYDDGRDADAICRKALATMFAHFTQETGGHTGWWVEEEWRQGLVYVREMGWSEDMAGGYGICGLETWQGQTWPCAVYPQNHANAGQFKSYFGRGAKQLSYNYNYGPFSQAMFGDVNVLLEHPEWVADTWLNLASAVFFFVYPQPPKPSMLHVIDGTWQPNANDLAAGLEPGFGVTTQIINGGIECGGSTEHQQSLNRMNYYRQFAGYLGVPVAQDEKLGCAGMKQFDSNGAGALPIYWEQSWSDDNSCKLVGYQTAYSAFIPGDYVKCVEHFYDVEVVNDL